MSRAFATNSNPAESASAPSAASATASKSRTPERGAPGIRRRLLLLLLPTLALLLALSILGDYRAALDPARQAYDHALADAAVAVAAHLQVREDGIRLDLPPQALRVLRTDRFDEIHYRIVDPRGETIAGDPDLPLADPLMDGNPGFYDALYQGKPVRVVVYRAATAQGEAAIHVAETMRKREQVARRILTALVLPSVTLVVATLLLAYLAVRHGLRPLDRLRRDIDARAPNDLRPLVESEVPDEVQPLVKALNRLLRLTRESAEAQQRFLASAAHQLRTPLAGLQAQLELAGAEDSPGQLRPRLERLREGMRRLAHMTNQLLALARAEPSANLAQNLQRMDLREIVEGSTATHLDAALAKEIDIGFEAQPAPVLGSAWLLRELLANLLDNAIAYTPRGGRVTVRSGSAGDTSFLEVEDSGPGIPESERGKVFERFYRSPGSAGEGCGLGLAIVAEIAGVHGAHIEFGSHPGTRIRVSFERTA